MATKGSSSVLWWIGWITLTIVSFFISCYFWTGFIAKNIGPIDKPGVSLIWVAAVFGSWMILLLPLIMLMYAKVDKAYEDARINRETRQAKQAQAENEWGVRSLDIEQSERLLTKSLREKLRKIPEAVRRGHLVTLLLTDGRKIEYVFIRSGKEIQGIYDTDKVDFRISEIVDIMPANLDQLPLFKPERWLRLDGAGIPVYNTNP